MQVLVILILSQTAAIVGNNHHITSGVVVLWMLLTFIAYPGEAGLSTHFTLFLSNNIILDTYDYLLREQCMWTHQGKSGSLWKYGRPESSYHASVFMNIFWLQAWIVNLLTSNTINATTALAYCHMCSNNGSGNFSRKQQELCKFITKKLWSYRNKKWYHFWLYWKIQGM